MVGQDGLQQLRGQHNVQASGQLLGGGKSTIGRGEHGADKVGAQRISQAGLLLVGGRIGCGGVYGFVATAEDSYGC